MNPLSDPALTKDRRDPHTRGGVDMAPARHLRKIGAHPPEIPTLVGGGPSRRSVDERSYWDTHRSGLAARLSLIRHRFRSILSNFCSAESFCCPGFCFLFFFFPVFGWSRCLERIDEGPGGRSDLFDCLGKGFLVHFRRSPGAAYFTDVLQGGVGDFTVSCWRFKVM